MTNSPLSNRNNLLVVLGIFVLALIGVGFLVLAVFLLVRGSGGTASAVASPTRAGVVATVAGTQEVFIPTTTQSPPTDTVVPTVAATPTVAPAAVSATPVVTATAAPKIVTMVKPANVRAGPGLTYAIVAGLNTGDTATVVGRDDSAQWFAVAVAGAPQGTGWVSVLVATYSGNISDLPVVQSASAPPPQATAVPPTNAPAPTSQPAAGPTNTPAVAGANGIQTLLFQMHSTTGSPNQSMFFDFTVVNTTASPIAGYGILAAHTDQGVTADSWHDPLLPGKQLKWTDHINFPNTGTYQVYLGICYSSHDACKTGGAPWTRLSNSITVTIQ